MSTPRRKIISFDVGIKNMAYCVFDVSGTTWQILDWNTINLLETAPATAQTCNQCLVKGGGICGKRAKYEKNENYYCEMHGKKSGHMMPSKDTYPAFLKKQKVGALHAIAMVYNIPGISASEKRSDLIQKILDFFDQKCLKLVEKKVEANSKKESLVTIARNIRDKFDVIESFKNGGIADVLIENQISPIASRMTTIQGLLTQYFVMRHDGESSPLNIEFISSKNKLKMFTKEEVTDGGDENEVLTEHQKYKSHKVDSVVYTKQILEGMPGSENHKWLTVLETAKRDDLADCFLQGYWFINNK